MATESATRAGSYPGGRGHPHRGHARVVHSRDPDAHNRAGHEQRKPPREAAGHHEERDPRGGDGNDNGEQRGRDVVGGGHAHLGGEHPREVHEPDARAHRKDAGEPQPPRTAAGSRHPAREIQRRERREDRDHVGERHRPRVPPDMRQHLMIDRLIALILIFPVGAREARRRTTRP